MPQGGRGKAPPKPGPGEIFRDCADCPEMVVVPAGSFTMGSRRVIEAGSRDEEGPQHKVTIAEPFAAGRFTVTFTEWDACAWESGFAGVYRPDDRGWAGAWSVINVDWKDAKAYVQWLSQKTKAYRLLSEAEREYAAREPGTPLLVGGLDHTGRRELRWQLRVCRCGERGEFRRNMCRWGEL